MTSTASHSENLAKSIAQLRSDENWKYTSLARLANFEPSVDRSALCAAEVEQLNHVKAAVLKKMGIRDSELASQWNVLVLADARVVEQASVFIREQTEWAANTQGSSNTFSWLPQFCSAENCTIQLKKGLASARAPIKLLILDTQGMRSGSNVANLALNIVADEGSNSDIVFVSMREAAAQLLSLQNISLRLGASAQVRFFLAQEASLDSVSLMQQQAFVAAGSRLDLLTITRSHGLIRNDLEVNLEGLAAEADLRSYYSPFQSGHVDNHTVVRHGVQHTTSSQLYKGLVFDKGRAVFNGKVIIEKGADGSSASQLNRTILMSQGARVDTKPELQIHADDIACSHGASVGPLSEDEIFYLQSRCLTREQSVSLICEGFISEVAQSEAFQKEHFQMTFREWSGLARGQPEWSPSLVKKEQR